MTHKARFILAATQSSMMVFMVTLVVTYLNLGLRPDFVLQWAKAYIVAWPVAACTAYLVMPLAQRVTEAHRRPDRRQRLMLSALGSWPAPSKPASSRRPARRSLRRGDRQARKRGGGLRHARPRRRARGGASARHQGQAAARPAGRAQGHFRHRRHADRIRLADLSRLPAQGGCLAGGADPPRRRHADRQDRDHRVRPSRSRQNPQPAQPRATPGGSSSGSAAASPPASFRSRPAPRPAAR